MRFVLGINTAPARPPAFINPNKINYHNISVLQQQESLEFYYTLLLILTFLPPLMLVFCKPVYRISVVCCEYVASAACAGYLCLDFKKYRSIAAATAQFVCLRVVLVSATALSLCRHYIRCVRVALTVLSVCSQSVHVVASALLSSCGTFVVDVGAVGLPVWRQSVLLSSDSAIGLSGYFARVAAALISVCRCFVRATKSGVRTIVRSAVCLCGRTPNATMPCKFTPIKPSVCVLSRLLPIAGRVSKLRPSTATSRRLRRSGLKEAYQKYQSRLLDAGKIARAAVAAKAREIAARPKKPIVRRVGVVRRPAAGVNGFAGGVISVGGSICSTGSVSCPVVVRPDNEASSKNPAAAVPSVVVAAAAKLAEKKRRTESFAARGGGAVPNPASVVPSIVVAAAANLPQDTLGNGSVVGAGRGAGCGAGRGAGRASVANPASVVPLAVVAAAGRGNTRTGHSSFSSYRPLPKDTTQWNPSVSRAP